jgi:hypothetical protein
MFVPTEDQRYMFAAMEGSVEAMAEMNERLVLQATKLLEVEKALALSEREAALLNDQLEAAYEVRSGPAVCSAMLVEDNRCPTLVERTTGPPVSAPTPRSCAPCFPCHISLLCLHGKCWVHGTVHAFVCIGPPLSRFDGR